MYNNLIQNKNILIIDGIGSLGLELVDEVLKLDSKVVCVFDVDETEQYEFQHELKEHEDTVRFLLGDVRDRERLIRAAEDVDIIFHNADLKYMMAYEYNPFEAVNCHFKYC